MLTAAGPGSARRNALAAQASVREPGQARQQAARPSSPTPEQSREPVRAPAQDRPPGPADRCSGHGSGCWPAALARPGEPESGPVASGRARLRQAAGRRRQRAFSWDDNPPSTRERQGPEHIGDDGRHGRGGHGQPREPGQPLPQRAGRLFGFRRRYGLNDDSRTPCRPCRGTPSRPRPCSRGWPAGSRPCPPASGPARCPAPPPDGSRGRRARHRA